MQKILVYVSLLMLACACTPVIAEPERQALERSKLTQSKRESVPVMVSSKQEPTITPEPELELSCVVSAQALNVRSCGSVACSVIAWLEQGERIKLTGRSSGSWYELEPGRWVNSVYLEECVK